MTSGEYLVTRAAEEGEETITAGIVKISVDLEVQALTEEDLIDNLEFEMNGREIPADECVGAQGFSAQFEADHPRWKYEQKLGRCVAVIWHPDTIIPPCTVLDKRAVIYGVVNKERA